MTHFFMQVTVMVLIIVGIICTEMWSSVSWFVQFKRMFAISFFISLVWNWFYLYKVMLKSKDGCLDVSFYLIRMIIGLIFANKVSIK